MKRYLNNSCHFLTSGTLDGSNGTLALLPGRWTRWLPIYSQDRLQRSVPEPLRQWVSLPSPSSPISSMCKNCYKIIIHPHHSHNSQLCAFRPSSLHHPVFPQVSSQPSCIGLFSGCGSHIWRVGCIAAIRRPIPEYGSARIGKATLFVCFIAKLRGIGRCRCRIQLLHLKATLWTD